MSHAEAFGHLRSFVVGLEVKARDLRKVLESSRDEDGKWVNGKDGTGIGERCARAIGAASPEQVTKDMIAEVAEQDKVMRRVEEAMRTDKPIEEATEKYQALVEYNQLALEDLEDRLSAYGYVRPARVALVKKAEVDPPVVVSSVARLPARTKTASKSTAQICDRRDGTGGGGGGGGGGRSVVSTGYDATPCDSSVSQQKQQEEEDSGGLEAGSGAAASAFANPGTGGGEDHDHHDEPSAATTRELGVVGGEETSADELDGASVGAVTPARPALAAGEAPEEEEPGSPPTPTSPGLADWEITEEAREMLRRAQPQQQPQQQQQRQQQQQQKSKSGSAAPRSLEALLAVNTAISGGGGGGADPSGRRSSVSSNWSPPPSSSSKAALSRSSSRQQQRSLEGGAGGGGGGDVGVGVGTPERGVRAAGTAEMEPSAATTTGMRMEMASAWRSGSGSDSDSNPPTPPRMEFEGEGPPWTPGGKIPAAAAATAPGTADRESSLMSPSLGSRSPLKSNATAYLVETAMSCGKRLSISTPSEKGSDCSVMSPPQPPPIRRASMEGDEASLADSLRKGLRGDFWGNTSPASSVVAPSRETSGEQPSPMSPDTPASPQMLSPRFRIESAGRGLGPGGADENGGGAASAGYPSPSGPSTRSSSSRKMALTQKVALCNDNSNDDDDNSNRVGGINHNNNQTPHDDDDVDDDDDDGSDKCPTPELSSPLRSRGVISSRDLEVLTPSAARVEDNGNGNDSGRGGGYRRGSSGNNNNNHSGGGGGGGSDDDSDTCPTPELSSPLRSTGSAALCRRRLEEAGGGSYGGGGGGDCDGKEEEEEAAAAEMSASDGPLELVSEEEYARAPKFLTIQVSRSVLNDTIGNLNAYAAPRLASPSELLLTVNEIMGIIDQGELSRTLLLSAAHLKRVEMKSNRMYRIRA